MKNLYLFFGLLVSLTLNAQANLFSSSLNLNQQSSLNENEIRVSYKVINKNALSNKLITFNPFDNVALVIQKDEALSKNSSWVGKLKDYKTGYFILSESNGIYFGKVVLNTGEILTIAHQKNNIYKITEINTKQFNAIDECKTDTLDNHNHNHNDNQPIIDHQNTPNEDSNASPDYGIDICDTSVACQDTAVQMDVLVLYTDDVLAAQGSIASIEASIQAAITESNMVLSNSLVGSGTNHTFNLVGTALYDYNETGDSSLDLPAIRDDIEVIRLRHKYAADFVALITNNLTNTCGRAYLNTNPIAYDAASAFSVTRWICMTGNLTLPHELGHNLGFRHNRDPMSPNSSICGYAYGYVNENASNSSAQRWRTVMAINTVCANQGFNCTRQPHFSNPNVNFNGEPTGKAISDVDAAYNIEVIERAACHAANFSVPASCVDCEVYQNCENYAPTFNAGPGNTLQLNITDSFNTVFDAESVEVCITLYGDNNSSSEQFNVVDENGTTLGTTTIGRDCDIPTRTCFTLSGSDYNNFIADGTISITIDPSSTGVNPSFCNQNYACLEVVVENSAVLNTSFEQSLSQLVKIYPNPANTHVYINSKIAITNVELVSSLGQSVMSSFGNQSKIDISLLPSGLYFIKINSNMGSITKKIVKN